VSATDGVGGGTAAATPWLHQIGRNAKATMATLVRPPRRAVPGFNARDWAVLIAGAAAAILAVMVTIDVWLGVRIVRLPAAVVGAFDRFTDLGLGGVFFWPLGLTIIGIALLSPRLAQMSRLVLAAFTVRLGFVLIAIAVPGLFAAIIKRLIGRARPKVAGGDTFAYVPFGWVYDYASLPSGHATTAFAALVAIGAIFPQARALLWIYAILIAISRVALRAHYPSDVVAGAIVGATGAWLVQQWFAARGLGFSVTADGAVRPMPGPSFRRIVKALARRGPAA
jgi:membrane-associated phospholipid phosphatase